MQGSPTAGAVGGHAVIGAGMGGFIGGPLPPEEVPLEPQPASDVAPTEARVIKNGARRVERMGHASTPGRSLATWA